MSSTKTVRFLLRPRRQRDPLAADFEAPQNVLVPKDGTDIEKVKKRLPDFPAEVFPSTEETKTGMLQRAHESNGFTFDPDLLEAMSKDFDYDDPNNTLDNDFVTQAGGLIEDEGELRLDELELMDDDMGLDGDFDEVHVVPPKSGSKDYDDDDFLDGEDNDEDDDNQSRRSGVFTNYSLTSSVMRRNQGLQQIDEHFERLYEREYADDTEIGPLDLNDVKGEELLSNLDQIRQLKKEIKIVRKRNHGDDYEPEPVPEKYLEAVIGDDDQAEEELVEVEVPTRENRVDCESILTYNSNLYNHPKLIVEPRKKTTSQSTVDQMEAESNNGRAGRAESIASSRATVLSKLSVRPDNETLEDKRARKKALKQYRHERRQERKQNQQIFKAEHANLMKQQISKMSALKLA